MKRLLFTTVLAFAPLISAIAQETLRGEDGEPTLVERLTNGKAPKSNVEVNFQLFTSANAEFTGSELDGMSFKLNRVKLEIKGDVGKNLGYHYRQSFNKYADPYSLDNLSSSLELAYVILKPNERLSFSIGKQFVNHGGYEYYVNPIRVREFSEFNNLLACYQAGVSMNWMVTPNNELCFQVLNNRESHDDDIYASGLPEGVSKAKVPFMYTANWNSFFMDRALQFRYAMAVGQQAGNKYAYHFTCGNIYEKGPILAYVDVMYTRQDLDQHGMVSRLPREYQTAKNTEYLSVIGDIDYRINRKWNIYVKGAYETARVFKANGDFRKGLYRRSWNAQSSIEFFPFKQLDLFVFALYTYRGVILEKAAKTMGAIEPDTHRISLGLVYSIPIF